MSTVALNFQTPGYEMDLNAGRFLVNGQCGYILKPACLRQPDTNFDPEYPGPPRTTLTIQVSSLDQTLPQNQSWLWRSSSMGCQPEVGGQPESCVGRMHAEGKGLPALVGARLTLLCISCSCSLHSSCPS